jgi:hypothetical protein
MITFSLYIVQQMNTKLIRMESYMIAAVIMPILIVWKVLLVVANIIINFARTDTQERFVSYMTRFLNNMLMYIKTPIKSGYIAPKKLLILLPKLLLI